MLAPHCHNGCCRYDWIAKRGKIVHSCPLDPLWGSVVHAPDSYLSPVEKLQILHSKNCDSKHTSTFIPLVYCKMQFSSILSKGVTHKACIVRLKYIQDVEKWLKVLDFTKITRFIESKGKSPVHLNLYLESLHLIKHL